MGLTFKSWKLTEPILISQNSREIKKQTVTDSHKQNVSTPWHNEILLYFQFLGSSSDRYWPDIIIPEIFIIKCNLVCKKFWIKAQCQTTKRNKNFQAKIKSCNKWFVDRIGIYPSPRPQRLDWAQSSHWLAELSLTGDISETYRRQWPARAILSTESK